MATTHDNTTRIGIAAAVLARLELGSSQPNARFILYAVDNSVIAVYAMGLPAFPSPTDPIVAANSIAQATNQSSGVPHHFEITDRNGVARIFGTVGVPGSGADAELPADSVNPTQPEAFVAGQLSSISNLVYVAPP